MHTDAIKKHLIPTLLGVKSQSVIYATEADVLNVALFGMTAKTWREKNPEKEGNIRDEAMIEQLVVLANLESLNAEFIRQKLPQSDRLVRLNEIAIIQMSALLGSPSLGEMKKLKGEV